MVDKAIGGYIGRLLRVDLSRGESTDVTFDEPTLRTWIGGSGIGAKILYDEVPARVTWDDPENRLIIAAGPVAGTGVMGSCTISVVTVGPLTGGAATSQANGYLAPFMKFAGYDGVILQGRSEKWVYLYLHDGMAEIRDAEHLLGLDTWEMHAALAKELGTKESAISVFGVGPAGEHLVRFASISGDHGHVAGHNGTGAVMGAKRVKAIVAARGPRGFAVADEAGLSAAGRKLQAALLENPVGRNGYHWGTSQAIEGTVRAGTLPVKNYTTNLFPQASDFMGERYRPAFNAKPSPCWSCRTKHLHTLTVPDGPYAGFKGEEPDHEMWAAWGPMIGNTDPAGVVVLTNEVDRLGFEGNEAGWVMGWVMECYEKGILTRKDTGGLEMTWGNVEAVRAMLRKIVHREGIGDLLAEGVKRASETLGRGSEQLAIYSAKGNSPRGHDHRARWYEMLDTCVSDTGTIMVGTVSGRDFEKFDEFDAEQVSEAAGRRSGWMIFEDCLGLCRLCTRADREPIVNVLAETTGWDFTVDEAMQVGRRIMNLLRVFNLRRGLTPELEHPSQRYGSIPLDGPAAGKSVAPVWPQMRANYYRLMGWDPATGYPLPETLAALGLTELAASR